MLFYRVLSFGSAKPTGAPHSLRDDATSSSRRPSVDWEGSNLQLAVLYGRERRRARSRAAATGAAAAAKSRQLGRALGTRAGQGEWRSY